MSQALRRPFAFREDSERYGDVTTIDTEKGRVLKQDHGPKSR